MVERLQSQLRDTRIQLDDVRAESELTRAELAAAVRDRDLLRARVEAAEAVCSAESRPGAITEYDLNTNFCVDI